jgi:Flp pilus assembly protein TadG
MPHRLRRFLREREGTAAIEFVLLMPLLLLVIIGGMYLWSLASLHNTLNTAAYRAARYLSVEGPYLEEWADAQRLARGMIGREIEEQQVSGSGTNIWLQGLRPEDIPSVFRVEVSDERPECAGAGGGADADPNSFTFTVTANLSLPALPVPLISRNILGERQLTIRTRHVSFLECGQAELE